MEVCDKVLYHFHKPYVKEDSWFVGNEIVIDDDYNSKLCEIVELYKERSSLIDRIINGVYNECDLQEMLSEGVSISDFEQIRYTFKREQALENYRLKYKNNLPSRLHSLYLCDELQLAHWIYQLDPKCEIYKLQVTGNIFVTSDYYIPRFTASDDEILQIASDYWNPSESRDTFKDEILFQGKAKILEKIDKDYLRSNNEEN